MNNYMVAHLWANEKKESARGSNFFFEGESIYSYGYHFEVGRIVRNKRGEKAYLLNNEYYSTSTSAHQRYIYGAIPTGSKVFSVGYNMSNTGNMAFVTSGLESNVRYNAYDSQTEVYSGFGDTEVESRAMLLIDLLDKKVLTLSDLNLN